MSYIKTRNACGVSDAKKVFSSSAAKIKTISERDFGGTVFGSFIPAEADKYSSLIMNMQNDGTALCTRKDAENLGFSLISEKEIPIENLFYSLRAEDFGVIEGDVLISDVYDNGEYKGALCECTFHDSYEELGDPYMLMDPNLFISRKIPASNYILRIFSDAENFPSCSINRGGTATLYNGTPNVNINSAGNKYADINFSAYGDSALYNMYFSFSRPESGEYNMSFMFRLMLIDKGAALDAGFTEAELENLDFSSKTCGIPVSIMIPDGENEAECFYDGKYVFKRGDMLISFDTSSKKTAVHAYDLPISSRCVIFHEDGNFIAALDSGEIYTIDDTLSIDDISFTAEKSEIYIPTLYLVKDVSSTGNVFTEMEMTNVLTEYFYIKLYTSSTAVYELPKNLFIDGSFVKAYDVSTGNEIVNQNITLTPHEDGGATVKTSALLNGLLIKLRFQKDDTGYFTDYDIIERYRNLFFAPLGKERFPSVISSEYNTVCYGGKNECDIAIFNMNRKMYVTPKNALLAKNTERVTSVIKYAEDFLVFSKNLIRKMTLMENGEEEKRFSVSFENFKYGIGSDAPGSVVCSDDRIIYLNSECGIFYINRFGFSQKDMSRKISVNIERGEKGLFSHSSEELENSSAAICDNKYFLKIGDIFYVWDFLYSSPSASVEKESEERKMKWFLLSDFECKHIFGSDTKGIYFNNSENVLMYYQSGTSVNSAASCFYKSREYDISEFSDGIVLKLVIEANIKDKCTVKFFFDGEESRYEYELFANGFCVYTVKPEKMFCRRFSFALSSSSAFCLCGYEFSYY